MGGLATRAGLVSSPVTCFDAYMWNECPGQCIMPPPDLQPGTLSKGRSSPQTAVTTKTPALVNKGREGVIDRRKPANGGAITPVLCWEAVGMINTR
jgi:hypothetical protein